MNSLFPDASPYPEGFRYFPSFISKEEEDLLISIIEQTTLHSFIFQGYEAKRKVASFGFDWSFEKKTLSKGKAIPAELQFIMEKVARKLDLKVADFAELLILEYPPGAVMNWHRDAPPFDLIAGISLASDCTFKLRPQEKDKQTRKSIISIPVLRRSLYVMQGPARSEWQHSINPVQQKRYSITLRTLKHHQE
jgi:alkylated DNA repair dioxygenase AlkB